MQKIDVKFQSVSQSYPIILESGGVSRVQEIFDLKKYSKIFVLTDENVEKFWLKELLAGLPTKTSFYVIPSGEENKNLQTVDNLWKKMLENSLDRHSLVINLGGGVVTDLGAFVASTYMRGIDFLQIPTTLLSQVDASSGGKTGFDFEGVKNLVGTFSQPIGVLIDPETLKTLPEREFRSGIAEMLKHGLIYDKNHFEEVGNFFGKDHSQKNLIEDKNLEKLIFRSAEIKAEVVQKDEKEGDLRKILNFGHTIGHAIESLALETSNPFSHGEAVALGILVESELALNEGLIEKTDFEKIQKIVEKIGFYLDLKSRFESLKSEEILSLMKKDKKNKEERINFSLIEGIGKGIFDFQIDEKRIEEVIKNLLTK